MFNSKVTLMTPATNITELAAEYVHFQSLDKERLDFKDHIMLYEALNKKLEAAGMSFYDIGRYVRSKGLE